MSKPETLVRSLRRLEREALVLEPGPKRRRKLRRAVVDSTEKFLASLEDLDMLRTWEEIPGRGIGLLAEPIGEEPIPIEKALDLLEAEVIRPGGNPASAGHLAYIPGGGLYPSALGDYLAAVSNKYAGLFFTGPGPVRMENMLVHWVADLVGYPATAAGNIASGGSIASLVAIVTARDSCGLKGADFASAVVYMTSQAHYCLEKSLRLAGLAEAPVRHVAMDENHRMSVPALEAAIAADREKGLRPWLILAAAGTTDTGAVDPLDEIATVAEREKCWYHVDAAYGGFFLLTDYGREKLKGIERSHSVVLDPHKSLFLPYGSGMVLVRDGHALESTHSFTGAYMQDALQARDEISPADVSPELTKHFRALRMWLPLKIFGVAPFRAALDEKLLLARYFRKKAAKLGFEVGPPPDLSVVTYRWAPAGMPLEEANEINRKIVDGVRADGRVFISSTLIDGKFILRLVALHFRTHKKHIDLALEVLANQLKALGLRT
jgi:aromatic-L-amino-acid decarboxylase